MSRIEGNIKQFICQDFCHGNQRLHGDILVCQLFLLWPGSENWLCRSIEGSSYIPL